MKLPFLLVRSNRVLAVSCNSTLDLSEPKKPLKIIQSDVLSLKLIWVDFKETRNPHLFIYLIDSLGEPMMCRVLLYKLAMQTWRRLVPCPYGYYISVGKSDTYNMTSLLNWMQSLLSYVHMYILSERELMHWMHESGLWPSRD